MEVFVWYVSLVAVAVLCLLIDASRFAVAVSQFTLQAVLKGHKPDFHNALAPDAARSMYEQVLAHARSSYHPSKIQGTACCSPSAQLCRSLTAVAYRTDGRFGAMMQVALVNDGPVTIMLDSSERGPARMSRNRRSPRLLLHAPRGAAAKEPPVSEPLRLQHCPMFETQSQWRPATYCVYVW